MNAETAPGGDAAWRDPALHRLFRWLTAFAEHANLPPGTLFLGVAVLVGVGAGLGAIVFRYLILAVEWTGYTWLPWVTHSWGKAYVVIAPAVGGLLVGPLVYFFAREARGHGVPEVMEAVARRGGRIRPIVAVVKALASAICIGSGGSVGREGPIVQIGSALGSTAGQALGLPPDRVRNLVACGAAAGIAATFNAPIAGVIFALEVILGDFGIAYYSSVVVSAVVASVIGRAAFGNVPAFVIPMEYGVHSLREYAFYIVLGLFCAGGGVAFVRVLYGAEDFFAKWRKGPEWLQPVFGGCLLGALALSYPACTGVHWERMPQVYNVGYQVIEQALAGNMALTVAASLLVLKLLATSLTLGTGGSGGIFAPSLFMGAMLGAAFAAAVNRVWPGAIPHAGPYALVGMAAFFAAGAHAPMTAALILFELTGDYRIVLPLMLTVVVATLASRWLLRGDSIYTLKLTRRGVRLLHGRDADVLQAVTVAEVMRVDVETVAADLALPALADAFSRSRRRGLPVLDRDGKLWGMVSVADLERALRRNRPETATVAHIATPRRNVMHAFRDESVGQVLTRMGRGGFERLPVVSREDANHLLGVIRRADIASAYDLGLSRRAAIRRPPPVMADVEGVEFLDLVLKPADAAVNRTVQDVAAGFPDNSLLVCIRRGGRVIIPHGSTVFLAGDQVTAITQTRGVEALHRCLHGETRTGGRE
ncbi:MAG: chloride channel protein [Lentisphaeria bacterium]|nr:chloride channel protein [Lentisphaeria bacterium]